MTVYSKFNIVYRLQKWMDSVPGQTFLNYAYSWGASIVILGTLFKLTHLPGANIMLFIGMGTEVCVFFISAFDRPFDKTSDGKDIPTHIKEVDMENESSLNNETVNTNNMTPNQAAQIIFTGNQNGRVTGVNTQIENDTPEEMHTAENSSAKMSNNGAGPQVIVARGNAGMQMSAEDMAKQATQNEVLTDAQNNYVEELKNLTETLQKVSEQSKHLTVDSEEMENLNRTLTGICKVYEMQLKSASKQIGTIDEINDQTVKMANQITELNKIYQRMIDAMTSNMRITVPEQK